MAHRTNERRILAGPEPSVEPSLRKQQQPNTKAMKNPDPITIPTIPSKPSSNFYSNYLSKSLDSTLSHRIRTPQKPISQKDPLLKPKPISVSSKEEDDRLEKSQDKAICLKTVDQVHKKKSNNHLVGGGGGAQRVSVSSLPLVPSGGGGGIGRRRSLGGSHAELAGVFASNGVKVVAVDMPPFMQIHAARKVRDSLEKFTSRTLASTLKKEFDGIYGPAWHCIVGTCFWSFVTLCRNHAESFRMITLFTCHKRIYVKEYLDPESRGRRRKMTIDDESSIYVGGIPYDFTDDSLRRVFDPYGDIVAVKIVNTWSWSKSEIGERNHPKTIESLNLP